MSADSYEGAQRDPFALTASADDYVPSQAIERVLREATAALADGRVPVIAGATGLGKTLALQLLGRACAAHSQPVYVPFCSLTPDELASLVLGLRGGERAADPELALLDAVRRASESGERLLLLVDDAAVLPGDTAAQLAHWLNASGGALQIALAGLPGPALRHVLDAFGDRGQQVLLEQGLRGEEIHRYVHSRLEAAGAEQSLRDAFDDAALAELARVSGGNPRRLNLEAQAIVRDTYGAEPAGGRAQVEAPAGARAAEDARGVPTAPARGEVGAYRFVRGHFVNPMTGESHPSEQPESAWREPLSSREPASGARPAPPAAAEEIDAGLGRDLGAGPDPAAGWEHAGVRDATADAALEKDDADDARLAPRLEPPPPRRASPLRGIALAVAAAAFAVGVWSQLRGPAEAPQPAASTAARTEPARPTPPAPVAPATPEAPLVATPEPTLAEPPLAATPEPMVPEASTPQATLLPEPVAEETTAAIEPVVPEPSAGSGTAAPEAIELVAPEATAAIEPAPPEPTAPPASLPPGPTAPPAEMVAVAINATPWAVIEIDGEEVGETPLAGIRLTTGRHRFRARMPDGSVRERVVRIDASTPTVVFE